MIFSYRRSKGFKNIFKNMWFKIGMVLSIFWKWNYVKFFRSRYFLSFKSVFQKVKKIKLAMALPKFWTFLKLSPLFYVLALWLKNNWNFLLYFGWQTTVLERKKTSNFTELSIFFNLNSNWNYCNLIIKRSEIFFIKFHKT